MRKYILAYDMLCFLSCTHYSFWVYQFFLVYRFMINLFSIYKKALLIPRSGLDELPDVALFGLLIYWNDLQLSSLAFPEWKRNQLLMNSVRDRECFADFRTSSRMESQSAKNGVRRKTVLDWPCCCFESKWKRRDGLCSHQNVQGHHARPSSWSLHCPGVPMATGSPTGEYAGHAGVWHTANGNLSCQQELLLLICFLSWKKLSCWMNSDCLGAYSQCTQLYICRLELQTLWMLIKRGGRVKTSAKWTSVCCAIWKLNLLGKHFQTYFGGFRYKC